MTQTGFGEGHDIVSEPSQGFDNWPGEVPVGEQARHGYAASFSAISRLISSA